MATAAAPHVAAQLEGIALEPQIILQRLTQMRSAAQRVVVEGVGGFRVPLGDDYDTAQLALDLALPVVMVVGLRLGCINQALLTFEAIQARGLQVIGWVANSTLQDMPFESENIQAIRQRLSVPLWGHIPRLTPQTLSEADRYLHIPQPWLE
jgi:dethiobiotin synthetase